MSEETPSEDVIVGDSRGLEISSDVICELEEARQRIRPAVMADRIWRRLLSDVDRQQLGGNLEQAWRRHGSVGMWMAVRGVSVERAIVDVACGLEVMSEHTAGWLLRELGEKENSHSIERPHWDVESGELRLGGRIIRRVKIRRVPSNIQQVLDSFQEAGWPTRIENPVGDDQHQLHLTLQSLNRRLDLIRFHSHEGGRAISWGHTAASATA